jgi:hypothetical protein
LQLAFVSGSAMRRKNAQLSQTPGRACHGRAGGGNIHIGQVLLTRGASIGYFRDAVFNYPAKLLLWMDCTSSDFSHNFNTAVTIAPYSGRHPKPEAFGRG